MKKRLGFTLIELMIAVAIIGIIAAFAYPSYLEQVRKSRRADVKAVILQAAQAAERYYTANYNFGTTSTSQAAANASPVFGNITKSPIDGGSTYYTLSYTASATDFLITATPSGPQVGDRCNVITYARNGSVSYTGTNGTLQDCWR